MDDFEAGLPAGTDPNGVAVGFVTFNDPNSTVAISTTAAPPAPVLGAAALNNVLKMNVSVVSFAGFVHNFENAALNAWTPQDWSAYEGISFWLYGNNSGTTMFVDVLDNRNPGSTRTTPNAGPSTSPTISAAGRRSNCPLPACAAKRSATAPPTTASV
ncbi:MAG: hypothetical protein M0C28_34565 [Candidatus Moduliflexus flocculans]|nr:hypothetical protein [Candidatus Moduliflexus flocculans]